MVVGIERIEVRERDVEAVVRIEDPALRRTARLADLPGRALALLPGLARHTCENDTGLGLLVELADTETAHLIEHVAAELMALSGSPRTLKAETAWDFARDGTGVFRIRLAYDHDLVAVGALKEAVAVVEWLFEPGSVTEAPDIDAAVRRLAALRR